MFKLTSKILKNQFGFSLTEIMVGGAVLAGVALAGAQLFKDQKKAQKKVSEEQRLSLYHQNLVKTLGKPENCNATFKQAGLASGVAVSTGQTFTRISKCSGNCNEDGSNMDHDAQDVTVDTVNPIAVVGVGNYVDNSQVWGIESISVPAGRTTSGPITLRFTYYMNPRLTGSTAPNRRIIKDLIVNARFYNGRFEECLNAQESTVNNLQNDFCKTLNWGDINTSGLNNGQFARWNEETQTCELGTNKDCSLQGYFVDGISSDGVVKCRALVSPNDASILQNPTNTTCSAGQKPTLVFEGAYSPTGGKIRVICQ